MCIVKVAIKSLTSFLVLPLFHRENGEEVFFYPEETLEVTST